MTRLQAWLLFFALLAGTMLACNIPLGAPDVLPAPTRPLSVEPTDDPIDSVDTDNGETQPDDVEPTRTPRPTRTPVPTDDPDSVTETETPLPTFTPISLAPTVTPSDGGDSDDKSADKDETQDDGDEESADNEEGESTEIEPITLSYTQTWQLNPDDPGFALATVKLVAEGGDGTYSYFRDDKQQPAATFEYRWRACVDNSGTFRVDSADGQTITIDFSEKSPCAE